MTPIMKPLDRRLAHLEQVVNARSEEQIAVLERLAVRLEVIADSHRELAENIAQLIESHLEFHVESMSTIGSMLAEARKLETRFGAADSSASGIDTTNETE